MGGLGTGESLQVPELFAEGGLEQGPCVFGAVADTGSGTRARSSLSFFSVAQEGKGLARPICASQCPKVTGTH
jgi:hypothetical protein